MPIPIVAATTLNQIYPPAIASQLSTSLISLNAQSGAAVLAAGTVTVTGVTLTATSVILLSRKTQGGTVTSTVAYEAPSTGRTVGAALTGSFIINASVAAGTVNAPDTSTIDWVVLG